jgi:histidinol-phosphate aminotransferase
LLARADVIDLVGRIAAPYPLPAASVHAALAALGQDALQRNAARVALTVAERERVATALARLGDVLAVWPSAGNFLLVRFNDARATFVRLLDAGILVRDFSAQAGLANCLRITIGRREENDALLATLTEAGR